MKTFTMAAIRHLQKERAGDARYARRWQETGAFRRGYRKDGISNRKIEGIIKQSFR